MHVGGINSQISEHIPLPGFEHECVLHGLPQVVHIEFAPHFTVAQDGPAESKTKRKQEKKLSEKFQNS